MHWCSNRTDPWVHPAAVLLVLVLFWCCCCLGCPRWRVWDCPACDAVALLFLESGSESAAAPVAAAEATAAVAVARKIRQPWDVLNSFHPWLAPVPVLGSALASVLQRGNRSGPFED